MVRVSTVQLPSYKVYTVVDSLSFLVVYIIARVATNNLEMQPSFPKLATNNLEMKPSFPRLATNNVEMKLSFSRLTTNNTVPSRPDIPMDDFEHCPIVRVVTPSSKLPLVTCVHGYAKLLAEVADKAVHL